MRPIVLTLVAGAFPAGGPVASTSTPKREDGIRHGEALAAALRQAGTEAAVQGVRGTGLSGHAAINRQLGNSDYAATPVPDSFLARIFR
jgi:hypothetical protein